MQPEQKDQDRQRYKHIRRMILIRVLLAPFIIVMLVFGTVVYYFGTNLKSTVTTELVRLAEDHRRLVEQFLEERVGNLNFAVASYRLDELQRNELLSLVLRDLQRSSQAFFDLGVFDAEGNHVAYVGPYDLKGKNYAHAEWFRAVEEKGVYISDIFLGYRKHPHFVIAVKKKDEPFSWYMRATIDTRFFNDLVESVRVGGTGEAYLVNPSGMFQTRRRSGGSLMEVDPDYDFYRNNEDRIVSFLAKSHSGSRYVNATGRLRATNWFLVVRQEAREAYAPFVRVLVIGVTIILVGGGLVVLMAFFLASSQATQLVLSDRETRQLGNQLILAGRFAELGEMSVGIAHEINNPLQVMKSEQTLMTDLLNEIEKEGEVDETNLGMIRESACQVGIQIDRCKEITQGLLGLSRNKSGPETKPIDLNIFIAAVIRMVEQKAILANVRILHQPDPDLPAFPSDPAQLQQVFLNLLNNALYALKGREGGEVLITTSHNDNVISISVADDGCGIDPKIIDKIFLPFFTTKPVGEGTGLGLSTSFGIVERLGGRIQVNSEQNVGTVFTVRLPLPARTGGTRPGEDRTKEDMKNEWDTTASGG